MKLGRAGKRVVVVQAFLSESIKKLNDCILYVLILKCCQIIPILKCSLLDVVYPLVEIGGSKWNQFPVSLF